MEMNRRSFLEMVGLAGGSAAVYQMMNVMGLAAPSTYTQPSLGTGGQGKKVLILGGGLAGMVSAYELQKAGYEVQILEYRNIAGGRCWTIRPGDEYTELGGDKQVCRFDKGQYLNPGPWRVPHNHQAYQHYAREFGVKLEVFPMINHNAYIHRESGTKQRQGQLMIDMQGHVSELLAKAVNQKALDQAVSTEDKGKLLEALKGWGILDKNYAYSKSLATSLYRGYDRDPGARLEPGTPSTPIALDAILKEDLWTDLNTGLLYEFHSTIFEPVGGMDALAKAFENRVGRFITYRARVTGIKQDASGVTATYEDASGATKTATGDYCICTIPLSILSQIPMTGVEPKLVDAIKKVPYGPSFKAGVQYKRRFWEQDEAIYGGVTYTDQTMALMSYPANNYNSKGKGVVLGAYMFGPDALKFTGMTPEARLKEVVRQNTVIHPQAEKEFDNGISVGWHRVPWALGCYGLYSDSTREQYYPTLSALHDRFILAGEHISYWNAWQEGALLAGVTAVDMIHQAASKA